MPQECLEYILIRKSVANPALAEYGASLPSVTKEAEPEAATPICKTCAPKRASLLQYGTQEWQAPLQQYPRFQIHFNLVGGLNPSEKY